jgi:hypothetical protein
MCTCSFSDSKVRKKLIVVEKEL